MERPRFDAQREREFITRGWWRDDTLPKWLARHAVERPDSPAVVFAGGGLTWQTLRERALKVAQCLKTRGVGHGDVVAVQLPNIPEFIVAYFATNDCFWPIAALSRGANSRARATQPRLAGRRAASGARLKPDVGQRSNVENGRPPREGGSGTLGGFVLWDGEEVIYVGRTLGRYATIRSVLTDHCLGVFGECTQRATHYSAEVSLYGGRRESELLHEFGELHGRLPRCQTQAGR